MSGEKSEWTFGKGIVTGLAFGIGATVAAGALRLIWKAATKDEPDEAEEVEIEED